MPDLMRQNPGEFSAVEQAEQPVGDADGAVLGAAQGEGVRQPARHLIKRRRALQPGPAGEFGQGRDETGGITTGEPLRLVSREEQPVWQRGRKQEPPRPSRAP